MLNPSLDAYGVGKPLAAVQSVASGQNAVSTAGSAAVTNTGKVMGADKAEKPAQEAQVSKAALDVAVKKLNEFVAPALQTIVFSLDSDSDRMVVRVVDMSTKEVLRQIPNEEVLKISRTLDKLQGLVIRQTA